MARGDAARALGDQGVARVSIATADALARDYDSAYEIVAVTGSLPAASRALELALVVGGRMFVTLGTGSVMEACLVTRTGEDSWLSEPLFETRIEPLLLKTKPSRFSF